MTTSKHINTNLILSFMLSAKCSKAIRDQYKLNLHCIMVLFACYLYSEYINTSIVLTRLKVFLSYYSDKRIKVYISSLVSSNLITLVGKYYSLTEPGYKAINDISVNYDQVIYNFCSRYNIEL